MRPSALRLQQLARERAESQARRIPWQQLHESHNQYIDWQEFYLWVRSILEAEGGISNWLAPALDERCPGFLRAQQALTTKAARARPLPLRLEDWIDEHVFAVAKKEGWFNAITYYAVRDPRYQRAEVCWSECIRQWKKDKPLRYPSFEEWKAMAAHCDATARLVARERNARSSFKLVNPDRLSEAVSRYVEFEALAYWAQPALEDYPELPGEVECELERQCPGFLNASVKRHQPDGTSPVPRWQELMHWIAERHFRNARAEGWFDAVLLQARSHPRAIRTAEYAEHCKEHWNSQVPDPYPSFEQWRHNADTYVEG